MIMRPTTKQTAMCAVLAIGALALAGFISTVSAIAASSAKDPVYYRLVQYPNAGFTGFYSQIASAKHSIDMEMYELSDRTAEQDLAKAAKRGVNVRVLLDRDYSGGEVNAAAYSYLRAHAVKVKWAPAHYLFHIKATSFDGHTSDVSTANLTAAYYATTRDAEIIDTNPAQVQAIERTFDNDWNAAPHGTPGAQTVQAPGLLWSPNTATGSAETAMVAQIDTARHSIELESEELSDAPVYQALAAAARRGVTCRIVMTNSSDWTKAFTAITKAGCQLHVFPDSAKALYIHEKFVLDDPGTSRESLLIGSQNAEWESLNENRELGLLIQDAHGGSTVIHGVSQAFQTDFAKAPSWS
ncbi:MAG TPA: phospholipase D-like domain-containing protein [Solirubrobacteraceae bacterium]|jgi:phosphatidylserine/phosphatidylglycerophosphate/cardiolipin synthase-like enzyme|nr:phospholipase D-like domain-containing protein [Solirubrobacteraceae bacterium]